MVRVNLVLVLVAAGFVGCAPAYTATCTCDGVPISKTVCGQRSQDELCSTAVTEAAQSCSGTITGCTCTKTSELSFCLGRVAADVDLKPIPDPTFK